MHDLQGVHSGTVSYHEVSRCTRYKAEEERRTQKGHGKELKINFIHFP